MPEVGESDMPFVMELLVLNDAVHVRLSCPALVKVIVAHAPFAQFTKVRRGDTLRIPGCGVGVGVGTGGVGVTVAGWTRPS